MYSGGALCLKRDIKRIVAKAMSYGIWFSGFIGVVGLHIFIVDENCLLFLPSSVQALIMQAYRSVAKLNWLLG